MITNDDIKHFDKNGRLFYCIDLKAKNSEIFLTTNDREIVLNNKAYNHFCQIDNIQYGELNFQDKIDIVLGEKNYNMEELLLSKAVIKIVLQVEENKNICSKDKTLFKGFVSNIIANNNKAKIQISSNISKLNSKIGQLFSPICRECFGSKKCGVNLQGYKTIGIITDIISQDCICGNHQENKKTDVGYYRFGTIKFLTGKLKGIVLQIKDEKEGKIYLLKNTTLINIGDEYEIFAGCNKTIKECQERFNNVKNFRGEPYINIQSV